MQRFLLVVAVVASAIVPGSCQNAPTDSQTLRAILEELQQVRRELQTSAAGAQRVQITLYRLQLQDAAVARATRLAEEAHAKLAETTAERKRIAAQIDQFAKFLDSGKTNPDPKEIEQALPELKRHLEQLSNDEEQMESRANRADEEMAIEQGKLASLHKLLDELDEALQNTGRAREKTSPK